VLSIAQSIEDTLQANRLLALEQSLILPDAIAILSLFFVMVIVSLLTAPKKLKNECDRPYCLARAIADVLLAVNLSNFQQSCLLGKTHLFKGFHKLSMGNP
jgi:hypothetical protein